MNKIRYSQCWEDPLILEEGLKITTKDAILSITSGGDNSLFLLSLNPKRVISIDKNPFQNYLLELKLVAIRTLEYEEILSFLGITKDSRRIEKYQQLKSTLSRDSRNFWDENKEYIKKGVIHCGKFEKYTSFFRKLVLPFILSKKKREDMLGLSLIKQKSFYDRNVNTWRWKLLFGIFFSEKVMKFIGREKSFFKYNRDKVSEAYFRRVERGLTKIPFNKNYFFAYFLKGNYSLDNLPEYLKSKNVEKIKINFKKINITTENLGSFLDGYSETITKFNLSDIFEMLSEQESNDLLNKIERISKRNSRVIYWENLVKRSNLKFKKFKRDNKLSENLFKKDRAFFYRGLNCLS